MPDPPIAGPGINPPHVDAALLNQFFEFRISNFTFVLRTFDENAESEVFSGVGVTEVDFFLICVICM